MEWYWFRNKKKISQNDKINKFGLDELELVDFLTWLQTTYKTKLKVPADRVVNGWLNKGKIIDLINYILDKKNWG